MEACYEEVIKMSMQVKDLINMIDRCTNGIFTSGECNN